jgi:SET domain-containing protein
MGRILAIEGPGEMLLVKTRIGPSSIHGIGLFADEDIARGNVVWDFMPPFDLMVSAEEVASLPEAARTQVLKYSYYDEDEGKYVLCGDDARHFNHSETPNTGNGCEEDGTENATIALRDIRVGEEITCNYFDFDGEADERVGAFEAVGPHTPGPF